MQQIPAEDLVFIDESGITTSMTRLWARAPRGKRALGRAPAGRYERLTLLGALSLLGLSALMTIPAFTNRSVFRAFVEQVLVPTLRPGQVVIWDNLPAHKYPETEQAIREAGCRLLFLPRYSPEFNPIEPCWSKLKTLLRTRAARTLESLQEAVTEAMQNISAQDACGWFAHCGYHSAPE
ncbi:MAG: IS630 family transposase [Gemmatimonadota bacterium]